MKVRINKASWVNIDTIEYGAKAVAHLTALQDLAPNLLISCIDRNGLPIQVRLWAMDFDSCHELNPSVKG